jgi:hypothetical protein
LKRRTDNAFLELIVEAVGIVDDVISAGAAVLGHAFSLLVARHGVRRPQAVNVQRLLQSLQPYRNMGHMARIAVDKLAIDISLKRKILAF